LKKKPKSQGIALKKKYGQHFLQDSSFIHSMLDKVSIAGRSVFEIGPGQGALTREILKKDVARLWVFEIDEEWVAYLKKTIDDQRLSIEYTNILDVNFSIFEQKKPWVLLSNLPYQITFPLLHLLQRERARLSEGVIMVQEEVAQKIVATRGRDYGYSSLFFQHYFEWELMDKVPPIAFYPPPKVYSRLLYFKPKEKITPIICQESFWSFIKCCFKQPRRTLKNNLEQAHYVINKIPSNFLIMRAQQLAMKDFLYLWNIVRSIDCA